MASGLRKGFNESEEGLDSIEKLRAMTQDTAYNTPSSYSADSTAYPDNQMPFIDKHMQYLNAHPKVEARQYIANIRLMSRIK